MLHAHMHMLHAHVSHQTSMTISNGDAPDLSSSRAIPLTEPLREARTRRLPNTHVRCSLFLGLRYLTSKRHVFSMGTRVSNTASVAKRAPATMCAQCARSDRCCARHLRPELASQDWLAERLPPSFLPPHPPNSRHTPAPTTTTTHTTQHKTTTPLALLSRATMRRTAPTTRTKRQTRRRRVLSTTHLITT